MSAELHSSYFKAWTFFHKKIVQIYVILVIKDELRDKIIDYIGDIKSNVNLLLLKKSFFFF